MDRSPHGWRHWIQNLGFMAEFSADELRLMEEGLTKVGHAFIAYDLDVTKRYQEKNSANLLSQPATSAHS